jgi:hypothetical protein
MPGGARAVAGSRSGRRGTAARETSRQAGTPAAPVRAPDVQAQPKGRTQPVSTTARRPATHAAGAVDLELAPPQPSVARSLRLVSGQSAFLVRVRFDDHATGNLVDLRVVI